MRRQNFISSIKIPNTRKADILRLAYPSPTNARGTINVICGPNGSGKSYLLKAVMAHIRAKGAVAIYQGWHVEPVRPLSDAPWNAFRIQHFQTKNGAGVIGVSWFKTKIPEELDPRRPLLAFFYDLFTRCAATAEHIAHIAKVNFASGGEGALNFFNKLPRGEEKIYYFEENTPFMSRLEADLAGRLGFRVTKDGIELSLTTYSLNTIPYPDWSDGQKSLFYIFTCVEYANPDVIMLDEIENYLHPFYMTKVLQYLRSRTSQVLVMTHHPHVIFSDYADCVFYLEVEASNTASADLSAIDRHKKPAQQAAPARRVYTLESGFDKLSATYRLFDDRDRQLMRHAVQTSKFCSTEFCRAVLKCFDVDILGSRPSGLPDRQTELLAQFISEDRMATARVFDWGAGRGRTVGEIVKYGPWRFPTKIEWFCWEHFPDIRQELMSNPAVIHSGAKVLMNLQEIDRNSVDFSILANVAHELTASQFATALSDCAGMLRTGGTILVCEVYPLLHAEKFAVPYPSDVLIYVLDKLGYSATSTPFVVHDATAYVIRARSRFQGLPSIDHGKAEAAILEAWDNLESRSLNSYSAQGKPVSYDQYKNFLQDLTTIASIRAARAGIWH